MTAKSPKDFLSAHELIGFKRSGKSGDQVPRRASSAKVTVVEPSPRKHQAEDARPAATSAKAVS
jgi:hypothetical protein